MPFFSIIIPSYNRADLIGATLDSALAQQQCSDQEIIVVDDGSTDGTLEVLAKYGDRIRLFQQKNAGPGAARNLAMQHARGEYIMFMDSDDVFFPWALKVFKQVITEKDGPVLVTARLKDFSDVSEMAGVTETSVECLTYDDFLASPKEWFAPSGTAVKTSALRAVNGFTEEIRICEDVDLWLRLGVSKGFLNIRQPFCCGYRKHEGSISRSMDGRIRGVNYLINHEKAGDYPGGSARRRERIAYVGAHARAMSDLCLRQGRMAAGLALYAKTFGWHLRLGRAMYLAGFPLKAAWAGVTRWGRPVAGGAL